ncbi:transcription initiation factor TFIID subunit 4-like [Monodelphis domestica]|uniref:transcription initiation factor TFIID subunit 4-like n=1 Tax=Monodelphis domestica TaxID=13616 RepID=UPI0024E23CD0|nr:transcription initiation factor TFIID subunit 4-like [Monodelphis domestica]
MGEEWTEESWGVGGPGVGRRLAAQAGPAPRPRVSARPSPHPNFPGGPAAGQHTYRECGELILSAEGRAAGLLGPSPAAATSQAGPARLRIRLRGELWQARTRTGAGAAVAAQCLQTVGSRSSRRFSGPLLPSLPPSLPARREAVAVAVVAAAAVVAAVAAAANSNQCSRGPDEAWDGGGGGEVLETLGGGPPRRGGGASRRRDLLRAPHARMHARIPTLLRRPRPAPPIRGVERSRAPAESPEGSQRAPFPALPRPWGGSARVHWILAPRAYQHNRTHRRLSISARWLAAVAPAPLLRTFSGHFT